MTKPDPNKGATILDENKYDLVKMGLAWQSNINDNPSFRNLLKEVKSKL